MVILEIKTETFKNIYYCTMTITNPLYIVT